MKKIELLAPAGNMEAFKAAVLAGADAIYIGGKMFGARNYAGNFTIEEMKEAIEYAHLFDVKVYITVNTIVYDAEISSFLKYVDELTHIAVDALILQDIGMIDLLHQIYPTLELHASTQMHIHNLEGVLFAHRLGMKRAVLARELSLKEVRKIKEKSPIQLEIFGHGALCASYSGQCFMSYFIGGRSGNRGTCAQCCRQKYKLVNEGQVYNKNEYPLSMKDLNVLDHLKEFIEAGIDSIKIEGRMKRPEYVYVVTSIYRKAIDSYYKNGKISITEEEKKELYKIFNRQFTKGFLMEEENASIVHDYRPNHMGIPVGQVVKGRENCTSIKLIDSVQIGDGLRILSGEDVGLILSSFYQNKSLVKEASKGIIEIQKKLPVKVGDPVLKTSDEKSLSEIRKKLLKQKQRPIDMVIRVTQNKPLSLEIIEGSLQITVEGKINAISAQSSPLTKETLVEKMSKLGNTPYFLNKIDIHVENNLFLPVGELNTVRREGIKKLIERKLQRNPQGKGKYERKVSTFPQVKKYSVHLSTEKEYCKNKLEKFEQIYVDKNIDIEDPRIWIRYPRVMNKYPPLSQALITDVGGLYQFKEIVTDFGIHVTNSYTLAYLHAIGVKKVTLSYECNLHQVKRMIEIYENRYKAHPNVEVIVSGRPEVMLLKYDILGKYGLQKGLLEDRFHHFYPIKKEDYTTLYHYEKIKKDPEEYFSIGVNWVRYEEEIQ